jgi:hypothetical protein
MSMVFSSPTLAEATTTSLMVSESRDDTDDFNTSSGSSEVVNEKARDIISREIGMFLVVDSCSHSCRSLFMRK